VFSKTSKSAIADDLQMSALIYIRESAELSGKEMVQLSWSFYSKN